MTILNLEKMRVSLILDTIFNLLLSEAIPDPLPIPFKHFLVDKECDRITKHI